MGAPNYASPWLRRVGWTVSRSCGALRSQGEQRSTNGLSGDEPGPALAAVRASGPVSDEAPQVRAWAGGRPTGAGPLMRKSK